MAEINTVSFVDTSLRDGQMSLWATRLTTNEMLPMVQRLEASNFAAIEVMGSAVIKKLVRELKDDPFERIRRIKEMAPSTPLRVIHSRHATAFQVTPPAIYQLFAERLKANGVDEVRMSDPSNTESVWEANKAMAEASGLRVIVNLVYSSSPKHTDDYYRQKARAAAALRPPVICIKDPGGLLTPERTRTLVPAVQAEAGNIPLEFHGHCNNGLGLLNAMEAVRLGVRIINTAIPPVSDGASLPSVTALVRNLRELDYSVDVDDAAIAEVSHDLEDLRRRHDLPAGCTAEYDETYYRHQVPGGMISNLRFQLGLLDMSDRLDEVLDEVGRVREDLGFPIMVTPYSQFVGAQATMNVATGDRYGQVLDSTVEYVAGNWGQEEGDGVDPNLRDRLLSTPRARELAGKQIDLNPSVKGIRRRLGAERLSDDDFLLLYFTSEADVSTLRAAPNKVMSAAALDNPWVALVERLARVRGIRAIDVRKGGTSLSCGW